jgi:hypothetical protein
MKTVFSNSGLLEAFNKQEQTHGRTSYGQMYFEKNRVYSYGSHYLLGEIIKGGAIVINNFYYSPTTRRHCSYLWAATNERLQFNSTSASAEETLLKLTDLYSKAINARTLGDFYRGQMRRVLTEYFSFLTYTKTKTAARKKKAHRDILKLSRTFDKA